MIPNRGAWLEYETDSNEIMYVKIDRQRKVFITALLRALGYSSDGEILELLGEDERLKITLEKDTTKNTEEGLPTPRRASYRGIRAQPAERPVL